MSDQTLTFEEKLPHEKGFSEYFKTNLLPKLQPIEEVRLKNLASYRKRLPIGIIGALISLTLITIVLFNYDINLNGEGLVAVYGLPTTIFYGWVCVPKLAYRKMAKTSVLPDILQFFGTLNYSLEGEFSRDTLIKSRTFKLFTSQKSEDFINGQLNGLNFNFAEVCLLVKNGKHGNSTVFKGEIAEIQMHKNFKGQTIIVEEGQYTNTGNGFFGFGANPDFKFELVQLEDPVFEKIYKVYSTDQVEARYILTTSFIERLLKLREFYNGARLKVSFFDKNVLIAVDSKRDFFEPKHISESALNTDDIRKFLAEINEYQELINILKLNQNIGM